MTTKCSEKIGVQCREVRFFLEYFVESPLDETFRRVVGFSLGRFS